MALRKVCRVDVVVSLDACFKQSRRKGKGDQYDPSHTHPETVFVSKDSVSAMEEYVDSVRPQKDRNQKGRESHKPDGFEKGMRVPTSVLDECGESFLAADEKRQKASTQLYSDTGLMALLCRHDRVLWLANMTSPGERQHYALVLLQTLFEHLPHNMRVGLLYDIGCQLHRSCIKWDFLKEFQERIIFGISVFHAYGHQWPCQLIYHPRKCCGFGLSDGEGCERFWSAIKLLIPSMRMAGVSLTCYILSHV
jgi:Kyakuja-Dileera-Zisupton transposase